jgi:hypothetical protein
MKNNLRHSPAYLRNPQYATRVLRGAWCVVRLVAQEVAR